MVLPKQFKKFTGKKNLDCVNRYDYHLCICKNGNNEPYYAMIEYSRFGWIVDNDDIEILAYCELMFAAKSVLNILE